MVLVLAGALCVAIGFSAVRLGTRSLSCMFAMRAALSVGYGIGVVSVIWFVTLLFGWPHPLLAQIGVLFVLIIANILAGPSHSVEMPGTDRSVPVTVNRVVTVGFITTICVSAYYAIMRAVAFPRGDGWDAFAIWNLHARFLFCGGANWHDGLTSLIAWSHPDYPLLLPGAIANFWSALGRESTAVPSVIGLAFLFGTATLMYASLGQLRGSFNARLGVIVLLSTPSFIETGTSQYADVPLGFYFLATIALLCLYDNAAGQSSGLLALAGLFASLAAWTKNEGLLFLYVVVLTRAWITLRKRRGQSVSQMLRRELAPLLLGAVPIFGLIFFFKHSIAPKGDLFSVPSVMIARMLTAMRYWVITQWYVKEFFRFGGWFLIPISLVMLAFLWINRKSLRENANVNSGRVILLLMLAGYFCIYLITPYDLYWHLRFSLTRLFLQLWPSAIFLFFAILSFSD